MKPAAAIALRLSDASLRPPQPICCSQPVYEFHIRAAVRKKYTFDESLYSSSGNVIFPNFRAVRQFAKKLNDHRDLERHPGQAVHAGQLNAMGLIDEISHYILRRYEEVENPGVIGRAMLRLDEAAGFGKLQSAIEEFSRTFPPVDVHKGVHSLEEYLSKSAGGKSYREIALEEMILLWLANINPAFSPFKELFNDQELRDRTAYPVIIEDLQSFFASEKAEDSEGESIIDILRAPILASPHSLEGQLQYIRKNWGILLSKEALEKMTGAGDLRREETRVIVPMGQQETVVPRYTAVSPFGEIDEERFSNDIDWMPNVVLIAKNIYVWLDQLSKQYSRSITTLDQIPDEELDQLARWNISALWLIGIWERSRASQTMKKMMGNPEAVASAYSVYDYEIAAALGGEPAFDNLRSRAWRRGIRLAGDMVPNHVGIFSRWVLEHPEYFIRSEHSPFPNYSFTGVNLSDEPGLEIRIEDGYWTRRDAAVVFQRIDTATGNVQYLYHGNDGTHTPWNDTAQLDFLKQEVREAVIGKILHVARKFSIIRFDAAMVLTKQHFQRLWYPQPGSGGDIASRSDHALSKEEFDRLFSNEFWREVVDRINREMPNTLLLAEAFWLLEGYFVRTLGMHRVYNSAFMHMMMKEENSKYRELIRNTLAFNPEILKRYVNFMSNPDERTAVDQFGKDDKYFGVAMMMVTMPGLPMFAHGQVEGFTEKYGMEYQRAYYQEEADQSLLERHRREIFPLLGKRYLFSQVSQFELYDVHDAHGNILEQVFCFSNRAGDERAVVCYNNRYEVSAGTIGGTVPKVQMDGTTVAGRTIGDVLGLRRDEAYFYVLREHRSGLEFIRSGKEMCERGMIVHLQGFQYQLFYEFREIHDTTGEYAGLAEHLGGGGTASIESAVREMKLRPVHEAFRMLVAAAAMPASSDALPSSGTRALQATTRLASSYQNFLEQATAFFGVKPPSDLQIREFEKDIAATKKYFTHQKTVPVQPHPGLAGQPDNVVLAGTLWLACRHLDTICNRPGAVTELQLLTLFGRETGELLSVMLEHHDCYSRILQSGMSEFERILEDVQVEAFLNVNTYDGTTYYSKERFEELLDMFLLDAILAEPGAGGDHEILSELDASIRSMASKSGYRLSDFRHQLAL